MNNPSVCAIMLCNGRLPMVHRAIKSFQAQTYENALLFAFDTTPGDKLPLDQYYGAEQRVGHVWGDERHRSLTIGALRNMAADCSDSDIIVHWDSDDWSHPKRIEEQVKHLQESGADAVGYRHMLFWRTTAHVWKSERIMTDYGTGVEYARVCDNCGWEDPGEGEITNCEAGEAWLYKHAKLTYCIGTSLCYWRRTWQARPFPDLPKPGVNAAGEDDQWHKELKTAAVSSIPGCAADEDEGYPRMIASIHGANSSYYGMDLLQHSINWKRVPGWDGHCRETMAL